MQFEELRFVTQQAALDLVGRHPRPIPATVVLPGRDRTLLLGLPDLPDEDELRHAVMAELAVTHVSGPEVPCWGFVAEAEVAGRDGVVAVYGARRHAPHLTAAWFGHDGQLEEFVASEPLDPTALPFLHPLQHAVDALAGAPDLFGAWDPKRGGPSAPPSSLPLHP